MIKAMYIWEDRSQEPACWWAAVATDNGGDKDWGPFDSWESARNVLKGMVRDAFDEPFQVDLLWECPPPGDDGDE